MCVTCHDQEHLFEWSRERGPKAGHLRRQEWWLDFLNAYAKGVVEISYDGGRRGRLCDIVWN